MKCACGRHLSERQRILGAALLKCKACGQWLYAVRPRASRTGEAEHAVIYAVTNDEAEEIARDRLDQLETLRLLGVLFMKGYNTTRDQELGAADPS